MSAPAGASVAVQLAAPALNGPVVHKVVPPTLKVTEPVGVPPAEVTSAEEDEEVVDADQKEVVQLKATAADLDKDAAVAENTSRRATSARIGRDYCRARKSSTLGADCSLKTWSGRRKSNPQPTAWKITCTLKINNICAQGAESWPSKPLSFLPSL